MPRRAGRRTTATRSAVSGRFTQKTERQPNASTMPAPYSGPSTDPASAAARTTPSPTSRRPAGTAASAIGTRPPPPTAWTPRAATSDHSPDATAAQSDPNANSAGADEEHRLQPVRVGGAAGERQRRREAEQVRGHEPRRAVEVADRDVQVEHDARQHRHDHRLVEPGQEDRGRERRDRERRASRGPTGQPAPSIVTCCP